MEDLSTEEKQIYDRQIRIWGMEAQAKLRQASVTLHNFDAFNSELSKNIVLSGINLAVKDTSTVQRSDLVCNFYLTEEDLGRNKSQVAIQRVKAINPLVQVSSEAASGVVCVSGSFSEVLLVAEECRANNTPCYCVVSAGKRILVLADLIKRTLQGTTEEYLSIKETISKLPKFLETYRRRNSGVLKAFLEALYYRDSGNLTQTAQSILEDLGSSFMPSISVVAGLVAEDIVNFITEQGNPFHALFFDGVTSDAFRVKLY